MTGREIKAGLAIRGKSQRWLKEELLSKGLEVSESHLAHILSDKEDRTNPQSKRVRAIAEEVLNEYPIA